MSTNQMTWRSLERYFPKSRLPSKKSIQKTKSAGSSGYSLMLRYANQKHPKSTSFRQALIFISRVITHHHHFGIYANENRQRNIKEFT